MSSRLRVATLAALACITIVAVASMAQGSNGDPLVLGTSNSSLSDTTLKADGDANGLVVSSNENALQGTSTSEGCGVCGISSAGGTGVDALGLKGAEAFEAVGHSALRGSVFFSSGPLDFTTTSGIAVIPAGSDRVTAHVDAAAFDRYTHGTAMLQQRRSSQVAAVRPNRAGGTVTIFLNKPVGLDTKVAWFLFD